MAVTDDTESLTSHFPASGGLLVPGAVVQLHVSVAQFSGQGDDFRDGQLCDGSRVREWRVENGDPALGSVLQVDLVRSDTEAANHDQVFGVLEHVCRESRLRSDTDRVDVLDLFDQLLLRKRGCEELHLVALLRKDVERSLVHVFQQQDLDVACREWFQRLALLAA